MTSKKRPPPVTSSSLTASLFGESDARKQSKIPTSSSLTSSLFGESDAKNKALFSNPSDLDEKIAASAKSIPAALTETKRTILFSREEVLQRRTTISTRDIIQNQLEISRTSGEHHDDQDVADDIQSTLSASGVVLVKSVLAENAVLKQVAQQAATYHSRICAELERRGLTWNDQRNNTETVRFQDVVVRCQGRMDARYPGFEGDDAPFWESHGLLLRTVETVLYGGSSHDDSVRPQLVYAGFIFSAPGSVDQPWHQDGVPLFPDTRTTAMLPTYAINVFIPLESADIETGPTEFVVGSHRDIVTTNNNDDDRVVALLPQMGDVVMYDYRMCHRGTSNVSSNEKKRTRTVLYLMYARPWFKEHLNFGTEQLL